MKRKTVFIFIGVIVILLVIFGLYYNGLTEQNTKYKEFNRHLKDAINMNYFD